MTVAPTPGTVFYALASGLARSQAKERPFRWLSNPIPARALSPSLNTGEIDFGINNAVDMALRTRDPSG